MRARRDPRAGYTLLELMIVVVIIAVVSALAAPGIVETMRENKVYQGTSDITRMFRQARLEAVSRGTAVAIRFDGNAGRGRFAMYRSTVSSCRMTNWMAPVADPLAGTLLTTLDFNRAPYQITGGVDVRAEYCPGISVTKACGAPNAGPMWICYAPGGRLYWRAGDVGNFNDSPAGAVNGWPFRVARREAGVDTGVARVVFVPFGGGTARVQQ